MWCIDTLTIDQNDEVLNGYSVSIPTSWMHNGCFDNEIPRHVQSTANGTGVI